MKAVKNIRLKDYDYSSNGFYFVTLVADRRQKFFAGRYQDVVARFIGRFSEQRGVRVDYSVIMDNHVHMILILEGSEISLGEIIRRFKARTSHEADIRLWQPNYYEHVIRSEEALAEIRRYIENNPLAEKLKWETFYKNRPMNRATTKS